MCCAWVITDNQRPSSAVNWMKVLAVDSESGIRTRWREQRETGTYLNAASFPCDVCGRSCASRIGLYAYRRTHLPTWVYCDPRSVVSTAQSTTTTATCEKHWLRRVVVNTASLVSRWQSDRACQDIQYVMVIATDIVYFWHCESWHRWFVAVDNVAPSLYCIHCVEYAYVNVTTARQLG